MLAYGVPVVKALKTAKASQDLMDTVNCGSTLASAMEPYFDKEAVSLIGACQSSGSTCQGLSLAAEYLEKAGQIRKRVISSLAYPMAVLLASLACLIFFLLYVFPQMIQFSSQMGIEPPAHITAVYSFVKFLPYLLPGLGLAAGLILYLSISEKFRPKAEAFKLRVPLLGKTMKKLNCSRIARMLFYMLSSGQPLSEALKNTSKALNSPAYRKSLDGVLAGVEEGQSLSLAFEADKNFDEELVFAAQVGQESGSTANMLKGACTILEEEAYDLIKKAVSFVEPASTLVSGAAVAFIALSVFSPITKILGSMQ